MLRVKKPSPSPSPPPPSPSSKQSLKFTIKKPTPTLDPPIAFPGRPQSKTYRRKKPLRKYTGSNRIICSHKFGKNPIQYVAMIICHGSSCDDEKGKSCVNPMFQTEYDYVSVTKHGDFAMAHNTPQHIYLRLCLAIHESRVLPDDYLHPLTGYEFMHALKSTIHFGFGIFDEPTNISGKLHKNSFLKQHDAGSTISDLNIFQTGHVKFENAIYGIYLFKIDEDCMPDEDHNVMTVSPQKLLTKTPSLRYVAETARNLQSFIEPNGSHAYKLKENKDTVRLSDVLDKKGIFPPNTVVVGYVCRRIGTLPSQQYDSPYASDYTTERSTMSSSSASSSSPTDDDIFEGGAIKKKKNRNSLTRKQRTRLIHLVNVS